MPFYIRKVGKTRNESGPLFYLNIFEHEKNSSIHKAFCIHVKFYKVFCIHTKFKEESHVKKNMMEGFFLINVNGKTNNSIR